MKTPIVGLVWGQNIRQQKALIRQLAHRLGIPDSEIFFFNQRDVRRHSKWLELEEAIYATRTLILKGKKPLLVVSRLYGKRIGLHRNVKVLSMLDMAGVDIA